MHLVVPWIFDIVIYNNEQRLILRDNFLFQIFFSMCVHNSIYILYIESYMYTVKPYKNIKSFRTWVLLTIYTWSPFIIFMYVYLVYGLYITVWREGCFRSSRICILLLKYVFIEFESVKKMKKFSLKTLLMIWV